MRINFRTSPCLRRFYYRSLTTARIIITKTSTMAPPKANNNNNEKQPLKILMLHGYTQTGPAFHAKTRALVKHIQRSFPLHQVHPVYPTGPIRLDPSDIPGYEPPTGDQESGTQQQQQEIEAYGWWRRSNTADPPEYLGLEDGLNAVATTLREEGPFDGIIGFSQGAALAAMVASLLEPGRKESFVHFSNPSVASAGFDSTTISKFDPVSNIPFPSSYEESSLGFHHGPLKFALCYSGFRSPGPRYRAFYENPAIQTPLLHVLGTLDAVVDDSRSRALINACAGDPEKEGKVVWHPGGHFLPSQRPFLDAAAKFIKEQMERGLQGTASTKKEDDEEDVNNMDVPF